MKKIVIKIGTTGDTHGQDPFNNTNEDDIKQCDYLIHVGDMSGCNPTDVICSLQHLSFTLNRVLMFNEYVKETIAIAGNHDTLLDLTHRIQNSVDETIDIFPMLGKMSEEISVYSDNWIKGLSGDCELFKTEEGINILTIPFTNPIDDIFGKGNDPWGFHYDYNGIIQSKIIDLIKANGGKVDMIVSHGPPYGYLDKNDEGEHCGDKFLLKLINDYKPQLVLCGHIHESAGETKIGDTVVHNVAYGYYNTGKSPLKIIDFEFEVE